MSHRPLHRSLSRPTSQVLLALAVFLIVPLGGCGEDDDNLTGNGSARSAVVRWELTPALRAGGVVISNVTATYHSVEPAGDCSLVIYDIDDETYGTPSYVQFLIPNATCWGAFEAEINGYWFSGDLNGGLGEITDLVYGTGPFASGTYGRDDDPEQTGTFHFYVDQVSP